MTTNSYPLGRLSLHVEARPGEAVLRLSGGSRVRTVRLNARPDFPAVRHRWQPWGMRGNLTSAGLRGDAVASLWRSCERAAYGASSAGGSALLQPAEAALRSALHGVMDCFDEPLVEVARRFHASARWAAYQAMASDRTGRVRQLAESAPGMLAFALAHARKADKAGAAAAARFLEDIVAGLPLRRAAAPLLQDWWNFGTQRSRWMLGQSDRHLFTPEDEARRCGHQRVLLQRAHPCVQPDLLWLPPPLVFVPEDVPEDRVDQERWFGVMKGGPCTLFHWPPGRRMENQEGFVSWMSRTAISTMGRPSRQALTVALYLRDTGQVLRRETNALRFYQELSRWIWQRHPAYQRVDAWQVRMRRLAAKHPGQACTTPEGHPDIALPALFPPCSDRGLELNPLLRASAVQHEGLEMAHCVGTLVERAAAGELFLFSVRLGEERLTLEILGPAGNPTRGQFLGRQNRPPSPAAQAALDRWWKAVEPRAADAGVR